MDELTQDPGVIPWREVLEYFKECREQTIGEMSRAETERHLWRAQGKMELLEEFLSMPAILATLKSAQEPGAQKGPSGQHTYGKVRD